MHFELFKLYELHTLYEINKLYKKVLFCHKYKTKETK